MVKQTVVLPFNEISGISGKIIKRNELWIHATWIDTCNIKLHKKKKKPVSKGYLLHDSIFITFSIWQNYRDGEEINGCQGLGKEREGVTIQRKHDFCGWWNSSVFWQW